MAIHGKRVELLELQEFCQRLLKDGRKQMDSDVKMGLKGLRNVRWKSFNAEDDLANIKDGYSFLDTSFQDQNMMLLEGFMGNKSTKSFFAEDARDGGIIWRKCNCIKWLKRTKKLLEMLMILCHILGGQPARGTELATLRWKNGIHQQRGIYWSNGTIMLLGIYSKLRGITDRDKTIPRYLYVDLFD